MEGDRLARGARSATFAVAPGLKFNEEEMRRDLTLLPASKFKEKYLIAQAEYDMLTTDNVEGETAVNDFAEQMKRQAEFYERGLATDAEQDASLKRECFLIPCVLPGYTGRVIVDRDGTSQKGARGVVLIPRSMRKEKTLLPTTGHIIKAVVYDPEGKRADSEFVGRRILFSPMSGTAICFKNYPTWMQLELSEILAWVNKEDAQVEEQTLEPMV